MTLSYFSLFSQEKNTEFKNAILLEFFGVGGYGSVNYERQVYQKNEWSFSGRIGLSTYRIKDFNLQVNPDVILPVSIKAFYGKVHQLELGAGRTFTSMVVADKGNGISKSVNEFHTHFQLGYRYKHTCNGFLYGLQYAPILERQQFLRHWGGALIGWNF